MAKDQEHSPVGWVLLNLETCQHFWDNEDGLTGHTLGFEGTSREEFLGTKDKKLINIPSPCTPGKGNRMTETENEMWTASSQNGPR